MKIIPAFRLRKPWYILLQYARTDEDCIAALKTDHLSTDDIIEVSNSIEFSPEEESFLESYAFQFPHVYSFNKRNKKMHTASRCLEEFWKKKLDEETDKKEYFDSIYTSNLGKNKFNIFVDTVIKKYSKRREWEKEPKDKLVIDINICLAICHIAIIITKQKIKNAFGKTKEELQKEKDLLERLFIMFNDEYYDETPPKTGFEKQTEFWKSYNQEVPVFFLNSKWVCYERTDGVGREKGAWGIAKNFITIGDNDRENYTPILMKTHYNDKITEHKGIITFDSQSEYLIAHLTREENTYSKTPTFFALATNGTNERELVFGYCLYYSFYYQRFLTKTVIWQYTKDSVNPENFASSDIEKFEQLDINIVRFLSSRLRNRLTVIDKT